MKVTGNMVKHMEKGSVIIEMVKNVMRVIGKRIKYMDKGSVIMKMAK